MAAQVFLIALFFADGRPSFNEKKMEATCGTCHPLDPVKAAHLSRSDWNRELEKMEAMGAKINDRKVLLNYLAAHYGLRRNFNPATRAQSRY